MTRGARQISGLVGAAMGGVSLAALLLPTIARADAIETIIVTAEKRSEDLQNTPIAISAFTADKISKQNILGPEQLQFNVPSMTFGQQSSYSFITLRGISTDTSTTSAEPSVATYEDGVYTGVAFTQNIPTFDLERIEVLRGPQGTLYGRNAAGGVVNFITKLPDFTPEANASVSYSSFNAVQADGGVTGALLDDTVAGRISVQYLRRDPFRLNLLTGQKEDNLNSLSARGAILIKPDDDLSVTLRASIMHQSTTNPYEMISTASLDGFTSPATPLGIFNLPASTLALFGLISPADLVTLNTQVGGGSIADYYSHVTGEPVVQAGPIPPDPTKTTQIASAVPALYKINGNNFSATIDWQAGPVSIKSISAYRYSHLYFIQDSTGFSTAEVVFDPLVHGSHQWTQEVDLSGKAFDDRLDWLAGFFYLHDSAIASTNIYLPGSSDQAKIGFSYGVPGGVPGGPIYPFNLSNPALPFLFQIFAADPLTHVVMNGPNWTGGTVTAGVTDPSTAFLGFATKQQSQSVAGFAQVTYKLTDALRITGGLRYTVDDKSVVRTLHSNLIETFINFGALTPVAPDGTPRLCDRQNLSKTWSALTGTAGVDYDAAPGTMVYAKYSRGYKAGGFNPGECGKPFDPEHLTSYEAGVKSVFWDGQILTNAALYYYDYSKIQFTLFVPNQSFIRNAGSATAWGAELEYQIDPSSVPGLQLDGSLSYENSAYGAGSFSDPALIVPTPPGISIKGNELIRAPDVKLNLGGQYSIATDGIGTFLFRMEGSYTDTIFNDIFNGKAPFESTFTQPAYWVANARLTWTPVDSPFEVQLFVDNLSNTYYATNRVGFNTPTALDTVAGQFALPRTFGFRIFAKFGGTE